MRDFDEYPITAIRNHLDCREIFYLDKLMTLEEYPHYFSFWDEYVEGVDVDDEDEGCDVERVFMEIGGPAGDSSHPVFTVRLDNQNMLELLDMRPAIEKNPEKGTRYEDGKKTEGLTAIEVFAILEEFFGESPEDDDDDEDDNEDSRARILPFR